MKKTDILLKINIVSLATALALYAYLGIFSRYLADDYCHSGLLKTYGFWQALPIHYLTFSNRYMILVVPYITDLFGVRGQSYLPGVMIILWLGALYWLLNEIRHLLPITWTKQITFFLAGFLAFFVILQAPNRYQSIYWQASSINRFVPLVLTTYLFAFLLFTQRKNNLQKRTVLLSLLFFLLTFLIGGFDEMNDVLIFALAFLAFLGIFTGTNRERKEKNLLTLTGIIAFASLVSVGLMSLSPGIKWRVSHTPTLWVFIQRILTYPSDFIVDSLRTLPLPSLLTLLIPLIIFFLVTKKEYINRKQIFITAIAAPFILYILLIINFSPSAYAQAYPADRALLGARFLLTALLALEGAILGIHLSQLESNLIQSNYINYIALIALALFSLYPFRIAIKTLNTVNFYRQRANAWDLRDAQIRAARDEGEMNISVPEFDSLHGIKELDSNPNHWVNRCASRYYGVDTITADLNYDK